MLFIFSTPVLIRHLRHLETVVFLHRCLIRWQDLVLNCLFQSYQLKLYNNITHGSGSGYRILFEIGLWRLTFWEEGQIRLFSEESRSTYFCAEMVPYLWRTDLSFRNSVTRSSSRAKCSNIPQHSYSIESGCLASKNYRLLIQRKLPL